MTKKKECFIIMPISDNPNYEKGHFTRVFHHLIKPACNLAGFEAIRADDVVNTNYIALDIIKRTVESEMAICDLSSSNPNVLYELGIRQAFNKPVTLLKDLKSSRIFDIQGFRDFEYDENLRIDNVEKEIDKLAEIINSTYEQDGKDINSLVSMLGMEPAKIDTKTKISKDTELILNSLSNLDKRIGKLENNNSNDDLIAKYRAAKGYHSDKNEIPPMEFLPIQPKNLSAFLDLENLKKLKKGDQIFHQRYGIGKIQSIKNSGNNMLTASVLFDNDLLKYIKPEPGDLRKIL